MPNCGQSAWLLEMSQVSELVRESPLLPSEASPSWSPRGVWHVAILPLNDCNSSSGIAVDAFSCSACGLLGRHVDVRQPVGADCCQLMATSRSAVCGQSMSHDRDSCGKKCSISCFSGQTTAGPLTMLVRAVVAGTPLVVVLVL